MSTEDDSQKTEDPTEKRIKESARKGDIPTSQEIKHWFMLMGAALAIFVFSSFTSTRIRDAIMVFLQRPHDIAVDSGQIGDAFVQMGWEIALALSLPIGVLILAALGGNIFQHKPVWSPQKLEVDLKKFNPISGFKRTFGPKGYIELVKAIMKIVIIGGLAGFVVWPSLQDLKVMPTMEPTFLLERIEEIMLLLLITAIAVMGFIAAFDLIYQRYKWTEDHKMTRSEVKDERRQADGDPMVKQRIKQVRMQRARERVAAAVPQADVVITNPTHFAVALKYAPEEMAAPILVAKGQDNIALMIRELAAELKIPVVENPPLARAIFSAVEVDEEVPPTFYKAVAEVIGYVFRLKGKLPPREAAQNRQPIR